MLGMAYTIMNCQYRSTPITTPEGYDDPPSKVLCPQCGNIVVVVYKVTKTVFNVCLVPCFSWTVNTPFLACSRCNFPFAGLSSEKCSQCGVSTFHKCEYCPKCGKSRDAVANNTNAVAYDEGPDSSRHENSNPV